MLRSCRALWFAAALIGAGSAACAAELLLTMDGQPAATIVVADEPLKMADSMGWATLTQQAAAEDLQKYIELASGAKLPIVAVGNAPQPGTLILVGRSALTDQYGLATPTQPEGLLIKSLPRGLALLGEVAPRGTNNLDFEYDRGTMHAVYTFLERYVGYRFYAKYEGKEALVEFEDWDEIALDVPHRPTIAIETPVAFADAPAFSQRIVRGGGWVPWAATRSGRTNYFQANHTHYRWDRYYKDDHPEYFLLKEDGTRDYRCLCYSEPGVLERELEHIEKFYESGWWPMWIQPNARYIPVEMEDSYRECYCARCQAAWQHEKGRTGQMSNLWWDYIRRLALAVKQRWPDKRLATIAYQKHLAPPDFDLPNNVDVMVCLERTPTGVAKEPELHQANMDLVRRWLAKLDNHPNRLYLWDYYCYPNFFTAAPIIYPHYKQRWLREVRDLISGEFINCGGDPLPQAHFMLSLAIRLLWDPDMDVEAYLTDYCRHFHGPAAEPMAAFYRLIIERYELEWPGQQKYLSPSVIYGQSFTPEVVDRLEAYLQEAELAARPSGSQPDDLYLRRVKWLRRAYEEFHPTTSWGDPQDGFFVCARVAHKWLGREREYAVPYVTKPPQASFTDPAWQRAPATFLVCGKADVRNLIAINNLGFPADNPTRVRMLHDGSNVYIAFRCAQAEAPSVADSVTMDFYRGRQQNEAPLVGFTYRADGELETQNEGILVHTTAGNGYWAAFVTVPAQAFGTEGQLGTYRLDIFRTHGEIHQIWKPWLQMWGEPLPMAARGKVTFEANVK